MKAWRAGGTDFQKCRGYCEPKSTIAFDEALDECPVWVLDQGLYPGPLLHTSRADVIGGYQPSQPMRSPTQSRLPSAGTVELNKLAADYSAFHATPAPALPGARTSVEVQSGIYYSSQSQFRLLFLHGLNAGSGTCVVGVNLNITTFTAGDPVPLQIAIWRYSPVTGIEPVHFSTMALPFECPPKSRLILNFGQPDPGDPSHFTIAFTIGGHPGTMHGRLQPDDNVLISAQ